MNRVGSLLLVVDVQEKLAASIPDIEAVANAIKRLMDAATRLDVPVCVTEHCPEKIGSTIAPLRSGLRAEQIVEKVHFSAVSEERFQERLRAHEPRQIIVCGIEAHVCVLQTALMLRERDLDTFLVRDASSSCHPSDRDGAYLRASQEGVRLVTSEMVLFEWMERADTPEFREILALIKSRHGSRPARGFSQ